MIAERFAGYRKIYTLFCNLKPSQIIVLVVAMVGMALLQTVGIASILPFIAVLSTPAIIETNNHLHFIFTYLNFNSQNNFLLFLGIITLIVLIVSNVFSAAATRLLIRFTYLQGHYLSEKLYKQYISQPYVFFLHQNTSNLTKNIITEVYRCVVGIINPVLDIISRSIIVLSIAGLLLVIDPLLALLVILVCGGSYLTVYKISRRFLTRIGGKSARAQSLRNKIVSESFGGIKILKIIGRESHFTTRYAKPSHDFALAETNRQSVAELPKYALETIIFGGILLILLYFLGVKENIGGVLPLLGLYAFAGYRLMPALQRIFSGFTSIRFYAPLLDTIFIDTDRNSSNTNPAETEIQKMTFADAIKLENIRYFYPQSSVPVINELNLEIPAHTTIGIVGETGSGKSTLIDIILGLLAPSAGRMLVDNTEFTPENLRNWQQNIGYVPQDIYLADDTVTRNIAFGIPDATINPDAVRRAAALAKMDDFITRELADGYETIMGERGVRLSGGQRQRIGIARALYHDPDVLILDEATSALDSVTENIIMEAIHNLSRKKTIIMIAHRITTIKECDFIYLLDKGKIVSSGSYDELFKSSEKFRNMAQTPNLSISKEHSFVQ